VIKVRCQGSFEEIEVIFAKKLVLLADALGIEDPEELLHAA
jgi:hypothetical protein